MCAAMSAQCNKTDKADALGIAHIMRTGWFRQAHNKSESCYRTELLLTHRRNLKGQVPRPGERHPPFAEGIRHPPEQGRARGFRAGGERRGGGDPLSSELMDAMLLSARAAGSIAGCTISSSKWWPTANCADASWRSPASAPVTALSFMTAIDDPSRFRHSRDVAA